MTIILLLSFFVFVLLSALCSGSETGVYKISKISLRISSEQGNTVSYMLNKMLEDTNALIFSILISNNLFNFIATTIATSIFAAKFNDNSEFYATVFTTPLLFVFGEVVPKNLFFLRPDALMHAITLPLWFLHKTLKMCGLTPVLQIVANQISKLFHIPESNSSITNIRTVMDVISEETKHEGFFSKTQNDIMNRMIRISNKTLKSVIMPMEKTIIAETNITKPQLKKILTNHPYTRILVYEKDKSNIIGYINIYKALNNKDLDWKITKFLKPLYKIDKKTTVLEAMSIMNDNSLRIALVRDKTKNIGIITIKDLAEELTGELMVC